MRPWQSIPEDVTISFVDLPGDLLGFCDHASRTIWLTTGMRQRQRRAVLQHELIHLDRGVVYSRCESMEEAAVEEATARALMPLPALLDALSWTRDIHELADELHVPVDLVVVRFQTMKHPAERHACQAVVTEAFAWA